jgi:hypothetical protein
MKETVHGCMVAPVDQMRLRDAACAAWAESVRGRTDLVDQGGFCEKWA